MVAVWLAACRPPELAPRPRFELVVPDTAGRDDTGAAPHDTGADPHDTGADPDDTGADPIVAAFATPPAASFPTTRGETRVAVVGTTASGARVDVTARCVWATANPGVAWASDGRIVPLGVGSTPVICAVDDVTVDVPVTVEAYAAPTNAEVVINELFPGSFVELANKGRAAVDLGGHTLSSGGATLHTFATGDVLLPGAALVVYAGDRPDACGHAAAAAPIGPDVTLVDPYGYSLLSLTVAPDGASYTLVPDLDGTSYVDHRDAPGAVGVASPCMLADGSPFPAPGERL